MAAEQVWLEPSESTLLGRMITPGAGSSSPRRGGSTLLRHAAVAVVLTGLGVGLTYLLPSFRSYQISVFMVYFVAAAGLTVLMGLNGQISLGHGAIMAVGGYATGFAQNFLADTFVNPPSRAASPLGAVQTAQSWTVFVSLAMGVVAAVTVGLVIGSVAARLRGPYLAGATLALATLVPAITTIFHVFNGAQGIAISVAATPRAFGSAVTADQWRAWVTIGVVAVVLVLLANLIRSRVGREFRAVRDDEVAAQLAGIRTGHTRVVAFVLSAATAGLGGGLLVSVNWNAQPGLFGLSLSYYLLFVIVIGGLGSLAGAAWGTVFYAVLIPYLTGLVIQGLHASSELTQRVSDNLGLAIFGLSLILVPTLAPGGIQNVVRRVWRRVRGGRPEPLPQSLLDGLG